MTYAAPPIPAGAPAAVPRRPITAGLAAGLLAVMGLAGLVYAVATIAVTPGVVDRFRDAAGGGDVDSYVTGVWMLATVGAVLAVVLFALYIVLALGLRRGANGFRVATWVVCGLGLLFGCGSAATVGAQRAGDGTPGTLGYALSSAYPGSWIELNVALAVAQVLGYAAVAGLLVANGEFYRRTDAVVSRPQAYVALPTYGSQQAFSPTPSFPASPPIETPIPPTPDPLSSQFGPVHTEPNTPPNMPLNPPNAAPAVSPQDHAAWSRPPVPPVPQPPSASSDGVTPVTDRRDDGHSAHQ